MTYEVRHLSPCLGSCAPVLQALQCSACPSRPAPAEAAQLHWTSHSTCNPSCSGRVTACPLHVSPKAQIRDLAVAPAPQAMSPLVLTLAQTLDPVIGSLLGWGFGLMAAPGLLTYIGGGVLLAATAYVTVAGGQRRKAEKQEAGKAAPTPGSGGTADALLSGRV